MQNFPHQYKVNASATDESNVTLSCSNKPAIESAPPTEFDGPGDLWSPEEMLVAAVADCFILSFKAVAKASKVPWNALSCNAVGTLDKVDRTLKFTEFQISVKLQIVEAENKDKAGRALEKAEKSCLITNSLNAPCHLEYEIEIVG